MFRNHWRISALTLLPVLGLTLISCEDNLQAPATWQAEILSISVPGDLVDNSPEPYRIQVAIELPNDPAIAEELSLDLEISGTGLSESVIWELLDDGGAGSPNAGLLQDPGGSGDVIANDGVFSALGLANLLDAGINFSGDPGNFEFHARLYRNGNLAADRSTGQSVSTNVAPAILAWAADDSLASGDSLSLSLEIDNPEALDLLSVRLVLQSSAQQSWPLTSLGSGLWGGKLGPEVGALTEGPSAYVLSVEDGFNSPTTQPVVIEIENSAPIFSTDGLKVWQMVDGDRLPLAISDSLRLVVPDPGETHTYIFAASVLDDQGLLDIQDVLLSLPALQLNNLQLLDDGLLGDLQSSDGEFSYMLELAHTAEAPAPSEISLVANPWLAQEAPLLHVPTAFVPAVPNAAPVIESITVSDTLFAGEQLHLEAQFSDPDGSGNLASAWLEIQDTHDRWFLHLAGDHWEVDVPENLAHFRITEPYDFTLSVSDIFNEVTTEDFEIVIENARPVLDEPELIFYQIQDDGTGIPITVVDTVFFEIPAVGDSNVFVATLPVLDLEGLDEVDFVNYTSLPENGGEFVAQLYDDGGSNAESSDQEADDGIFTAAFVLVGQDSYNSLVYNWSFVATDIYGRESVSVDRVIMLVDNDPEGIVPHGGDIRDTAQHFILPQTAPRIHHDQ